MEKTSKETLSIEEAARILGIGITTAYSAVRNGDIPCLRIGGRLLIPKPALEDMLRYGDRRRAPSDHPQR